MNLPYLIDFPEFNTEHKGSLSFCQSGLIPFEVKRIYWVYNIQYETTRGGHAHVDDEQVLICVSGKTQLRIINRLKNEFHFMLDKPTKGVYIPKMMWREIVLSPGSVLLSLASTLYEPKDYIRNLDDFFKKPILH
jgi:dTDP-4-dehydrorhamnose 3,5-epimerase-like enzyme